MLNLIQIIINNIGMIKYKLNIINKYINKVYLNNYQIKYLNNKIIHYQIIIYNN